MDFDLYNLLKDSLDIGIRGPYHKTMKTNNVLLVSKPGGPGPDTPRARILSRAREMFLSQGFVRVTVEEISASLGISKATLYKYYSTKEDLLRAVIRSILAEVLSGVEAIVGNKERDFIQKLADLIAFMGGELPRLGTTLPQDLQKMAPAVWREIDEFRKEKIYKNLKVLLESGVSEGDIKKSIDLDLLLMMFVSLVQDLINPDVLVRRSWRATDVFEAIITVFFEGIMTDKARKKYHDRGLVLRTGRRGGLA